MEKACIQYAGFHLGWLMGLEPTTTGITIQGSAPKADALTGLRYAPTEDLNYTDPF